MTKKKTENHGKFGAETQNIIKFNLSPKYLFVLIKQQEKVQLSELLARIFFFFLM